MLVSTAGNLRLYENTVPICIKKLANGRLRVSYSPTGCADDDMPSDVYEEDFDTVLCAIGRAPDLIGLNVAAAGDGIAVHPKSGKYKMYLWCIYNI